jgi:parallel beta-helix repeat protein
MQSRVFVALITAVLAIGVSRPAMALGDRGGASPFDGDLTAARPLSTALPTLPLDLGTDLSIFGVSSAELASVGLMASASSSDGNLVVDDDLADCPTATFTSIQAAVNAAPVGAKIRVCRGTYTEQVTIPAGKDGLTLFSTPDLAAVIKAPLVMLDAKAIVRVNGAQNVSIRHFTITGPGSGGCNSIRYGVRVDGGGSALIESNHITLIQDNPFGGCQNGVGVLVGRNFEATVGSAEISHNLIDRYQKGGVVIDNVGSFGNVHHNQIVGPGLQFTIAPNGIQVSRGANATADHNSVTGNNYGFPLVAAGTGILLYRSGSNVSIGYNDVFKNDDGISLYTTTGALIEHNNSHEQIFYDGLFADTDTSGNTFSHNKADNNAEFDCDDISTGAGTAGTANTWNMNKGDTENRPGLCRH